MSDVEQRRPGLHMGVRGSRTHEREDDGASSLRARLREAIDCNERSEAALTAERDTARRELAELRAWLTVIRNASRGGYAADLATRALSGARVDERQPIAARHRKAAHGGH